MRADAPPPSATSRPRAMVAAMRQRDGMWAGGQGGTSALVAQVRSRAQVGHRRWQGVYMSNTRDGADEGCI